MTADHIAEALGHSVHIVRHELRYAQAWLRQKWDVEAETSDQSVTKPSWETLPVPAALVCP
jgi:hypothetical protein